MRSPPHKNSGGDGGGRRMHARETAIRLHARRARTVEENENKVANSVPIATDSEPACHSGHDTHRGSCSAEKHRKTRIAFHPLLRRGPPHVSVSGQGAAAAVAAQSSPSPLCRANIAASSSASQHSSFMRARALRHAAARDHLGGTRRASGTSGCGPAAPGQGDAPVAIAGSLVVIRPVSRRPMNRREYRPATLQAPPGTRLAVRSYLHACAYPGARTEYQ